MSIDNDPVPIVYTQVQDEAMMLDDEAIVSILMASFLKDSGERAIIVPKKEGSESRGKLNGPETTRDVRSVSTLYSWRIIRFVTLGKGTAERPRSKGSVIKG